MNKLVLITFFIFSGFQVLATADGPDCYKVIKVLSDDTLNIRDKPSSKGKKVGEIPYNGNGLKNLGCAEMPADLRALAFESNFEAKEYKQWRNKHYWCKIQHKETIGYVHGNYLGEGSCNKGQK